MSDTIGTSALALVNPGQAIQEAKQLNDLIVSMRRDLLLKPGVDFGTIPGTTKDTLLKPGAEKICRVLGYRPRFNIKKEIVDFDRAEPLFFYQYECELVHIETGFVVGTGIGSCNSHEVKYRWRWVQSHEVPSHLNKADLESMVDVTEEFQFGYDKRETTGKYGKPESYWQLFDEAIADGTAKEGVKKTRNGESKTWRIETVSYRIPNPNICDQLNTIDKMAQKRSHIAATLVASNASEFFTQDVEDMVEFGVIDAPAKLIDIVSEKHADAIEAEVEFESEPEPKPRARKREPIVLNPEQPKPVDKPETWVNPDRLLYILNFIKNKRWAKSLDEALEMSGKSDWAEFASAKEAMAAVENCFNYGSPDAQVSESEPEPEPESTIEEPKEGDILSGRNDEGKAYYSAEGNIYFYVGGQRVNWFKGRTELAQTIGEPEATAWGINAWEKSTSPLATFSTYNGVSVHLNAVYKVGKNGGYWSITEIASVAQKATKQADADPLADLPGPSDEQPKEGDPDYIPF